MSFEKRDFRYLLAYLLTLLPFVGLCWGGPWSWLTPVVLFGLLPLLELILPPDFDNRPPETEKLRRSQRVFDLLLYLNLPLLYGLLVAYFFWIKNADFAFVELLGNTLSVGMICGTAGINVAHELGHRKANFDRWVAQALLLGSLYTHFYIEHNRGHHRWVATPHDPATARRGETVYAFWFRSMFGGWVSAWKLEQKRLRKLGKSAWRTDNLMLRLQVLQLAAILAIGGIFGPAAAVAFLAVGFIGGLMLETVNYLEHYGLQRREMRPGVYEPVAPHHSWNSEHRIGRAVLYELTRHADHHYRASRPYQILRHMDQSPQLPTGYPGMMLLSLLPPLWFRLMDRRVDTFSPNEEAVTS